MTWKGESRRHSLARRGIRTTVPKIANAIPNKIKITPELFPTFEEQNWLRYTPQGIEINSSMGTDYKAIYDNNGKYIKSERVHDYSPYDYYYHATNIDALKKIVDQGLVPRTESLWKEGGNKWCYLAEDQAGAIAWVYYAHMFEGDQFEIPYVLLKTKYNKDVDGFYKDDSLGSNQNLVPNTCVMTNHAIPPEELEVYTKKGWLPLTDLYFGYQTDLGDY